MTFLIYRDAYRRQGPTDETLLFWNIRKRSLEKMIAQIVKSQLVDIVMLAECENPVNVLTLLNQKKAEFFFVPSKARVSIFTRFGAKYLKREAESPYFTIRRLVLLNEQIILVVAHLPSKREGQDIDQDHEAIMLAQDIVKVEESWNNHNTIIVGDLNMNPFQDGVVRAAGFHGVMTTNIAKKGSRVVHDREYEFFYNPMWRFFGANRPALPNGFASPSGTCYYWRSDMVTCFWNVYDQVLIRPALIDRFVDSDLQLVTSIGNQSLVTKEGLPDKNIASDHLPLLFRLNL